MTGTTVRRETPEIHRDPLTGAPDAHPVGAGVGAAVGAGTGGALLGAGGAVFGGTSVGMMALGMPLAWVVGPIGAAVGAVAGGIVGGLLGKKVGHTQDARFEDSYWNARFHTRPYVVADTTFEDYQPAYRYGFEARLAHEGRRFDDIEPELRDGWEKARGESRLTWGEARPAVRDEWDRMDQAMADSVKPANPEPPSSGPEPGYFPPMF
jgi:hypothetical protein